MKTTLLSLVAASLLLAGAAPPPPPSDPVAALTGEEVLSIVKPRDREPVAVLLLTSRGEGEIGPCGCHARPGGGLARRAGFARLVRRVWPGVPVAWLSAGDFSGSPGPGGSERTRALAGAMKEMGYLAANVGAAELAGGLHEYHRVVVASGLPLLTSNLMAWPDPAAEGGGVLSLDAPPRRVLQIGGLRVGLIGVAALDRPESGVRAGDPAKAAVVEAARLREEVDFLIVLASLAEQAAMDLAGAVPSADLVFAGAGSGITPRPVDVGPVPVILGGDRGKWVTEVRLYGGNGRLEAAEFVTHYLGEEVPQDPAFLVREREAALLVREARRRAAAARAREAPGRPDGGYAGTAGCRACHPGADDAWSRSAHARAFETLAQSGRDFDPECQPCHVTGSGRKGGFSNPIRDLDLAGVQCEACHGPSAGHAAAPDKSAPGGGASGCEDCHDAENDPGFDRSSAWQRIRH